MPSVETVDAARKHVAQKFKETNSGRGIFCQELYDTMRVVNVSEDSDNLRKVDFKLFTTPKIKNGVGLVHGGASSTIISIASFLSLAADSKYWAGDKPTEAELEAFSKDMGYTRSLDIQIVQAVPLGVDITVKCHLQSNTKSNAFISVGLFSPSGKLLVSGVHDIMKRRFPKRDSSFPKPLEAHFIPARL